VAIAHQSAMTAEAVSTRPPPTPRPAHSVHALTLVEDPPRIWTVAKIGGLIAITAVSVALCAAILAGGALFAILNLH
jgi:hypothetical protein